MKKFLFVLLFAILTCVSTQAQQSRKMYATAVVGADTWVRQIGAGIQYHQLTWNLTGGAAATCQVELDYSNDGITSAGTIIAAQTCTSNGLSTVSTATIANYVRINVTTKSGVGTINVTYLGYTNAPSSGGGVTGCTTSGGLLYENGTTNTATCDANNTWISSAQFQSVTGSVIANPTPALAVSLGGAALNGEVSGGAADTGNNLQGVFGLSAPTISSTITSAVDIFGVLGNSAPVGAGSYSTNTIVAGIGGEVDDDLTAGNILNSVGVWGGPTVSMNGGTATNTMAFYATDQAGVGTTLNAAYYSAAQTVGANNYSFYDASAANKDFFGALTAASVETYALYSSNSGVLLYSLTAPTVGASGCGTTGASIVSNNGTGAFKVNVGTTNAGTCTITMPTARTDWLCSATDITTTSTTVSQTKSVPTSGNLTTEITLQNYTDVSGTHAWVDNDVIAVICTGE